MHDPLESIKPQVRGLRRYSLRYETVRVKLNQNENPWDIPIEIRNETLRRLQHRAWSRYPEFEPSTLIERLSEFNGWAADGILVGNGSNELIQALLMVTVGEGKRVLINEPTFSLYRQITTVLGGEIISVPLSSQLAYDMKAIKAATELQKPDVTIICSPNNPTGCTILQTDLAEILEISRGLVAVDEAYFEFAGETALELLKQHQNLVVLRTFSKALGMAALRVGYLLTSPALAREISKALLPYNLNLFSRTAAEVALEMYEARLKTLVQIILGERERLCEELGRIPGLEPVRSQANFMIVRSAVEPRR
ncbi:MAG TPA: aminotransferase class I/II-fold pyridoxal phosphate-dependent enzyme, partial [Blastocatellia bacterium]|nr:aminotransferase class I/II-fold pyridoxal phosphate-dependent enzyme [Blastocatellia bacterium]